MDAATYETDVVIVGAGLTGLCAAWVLRERGVAVAVVDRATVCAPCFKAEKIEPTQSRLLRKFGLLEARRPLADPIGEVLRFKGKGTSLMDVGEEYGMRYHDTVNEIRRWVEKRVPVRVARVEDIETSADRQRLKLSDGTQVSARLAVIATGGNSPLLKKLGMSQRPGDPPLRSLSFGFDLKRADRRPFDFRGFNYVLPGHLHQIDYITLFLVGEKMRANIFAHWAIDDRRVKPMRNDTLAQLRHYFPEMSRYTGDLELDSRIELFPTYYYRLDNVDVPGVVVLADEYQSVSPTTGTGLDKLLTDVDVLCNELLPQWLSSPGMGSEKISQFYSDPRKLSVDEWSRGDWAYHHNRAYRPATARFRRLVWRLAEGRVAARSR